jgi:excisionase family DNA binding protein
MMRWLKIQGACAYAGDVSSKTIYAAVAAGRLKAARVGAGRNLMFSEEWIDDWLRRSATTADERSPEERAEQ